MTRIAVVGAGAIGGFLAAALAKAGVSVAVVARGDHLEAMQREGLWLESDLGIFQAHPEASGDLRELGDFDALILSFKAHQWPAFFAQLEPYARSSATIVTLQNGLPFWYVRKPPLATVDPGGGIGALFSDERVVGAVVHVSGSIVEPGRIRQSGGLRYVLGDPRGVSSPRVEEIAEIFGRARLAPEIDPNVRATVWLKLVNNCGLNPVSVLRDMTIKPMLADPDARAQVRAMMNEALRVGQQMGVVAEVDVDERIAYAARLDDVKTSMLQDYERGRELELDPILGAVIELAERYGVDVPHLRDGYRRLRQLSAASVRR
ncbi:MAG TPA: 2-dehydropantoate 2-reductase [Candidatus Cybelea sp.]|nr:2-dehydropantoate 2-reductase [Candidatus Cybelea sp.]